MIVESEETRTPAAEPPSTGGEAQERAPGLSAAERSLLEAEVELRRAILEMRARSRHNEPWLNLTTLREKPGDE